MANIPAFNRAKPHAKILAEATERSHSGGFIQGGRIYGVELDFRGYTDSPDGRAAQIADEGVSAHRPPPAQAQSSTGAPPPSAPADLEKQLNSLHANVLKNMVIEEGLEPATGPGMKKANIKLLLNHAASSNA